MKIGKKGRIRSGNNINVELCTVRCNFQFLSPFLIASELRLRPLIKKIKEIPMLLSKFIGTGLSEAPSWGKK